MADKTVTHGRIGFLELLTLLFIALKLTHYIEWSWWAVLAPLWIPIAILFVVMAAAVLFMVLKR